MMTGLDGWKNADTGALFIIHPNVRMTRARESASELKMFPPSILEQSHRRRACETNTKNHT